MRTGKHKARKIRKKVLKRKKISQRMPKSNLEYLVFKETVVKPLQWIGSPFTQFILHFLKSLNLLTTNLKKIETNLKVKKNKKLNSDFNKKVLGLYEKLANSGPKLNAPYLFDKKSLADAKNYLEIWSNRQYKLSIKKVTKLNKAKRKTKVLGILISFNAFKKVYQKEFKKLSKLFLKTKKRKGNFRFKKLSKKFAPVVKIFNYSINLRLRYLLVFFILLGFGYLSYYSFEHLIKDLPDPSTLNTYTPSLTTKIYDRNGILLYKIYKDENRTLVNLDQIPDYLIQATIAIEDQNFYQHPGFSIKGISRALKVNITQEQLHGGSTITQQLIKNTLLTPERTFERKVKELLLSFLTEFYFSKDEILSMYLNQVPYGGSAYGVEAAAQMYFGKSVSQVNLAEAAFIAGLPVSPTKYSPYGPHPEHAHTRKNQVLRRMVEDGYITQEQANEAKNQELTVLPPKIDLIAPHFVMYVKDELAKLYGDDLVERGGLEVTTSLDLATQLQAQEIVSKEVSNLRSLNVSNGAALITNPSNGEVLAMVGSINYFDSANDGQVNVTLRNRQPGSSIKPLTYALGLERGLNPSTIIPDTPICYQIQGQREPYCPKNYDGNFHGNVTIRQALASSYNIPAVKVLAQFSLNDYIDHAKEMGITTWEDRSRFGLALTLGGGEVKMTDMAVAYGVFANMGQRVGLTPILEVKTVDGEILSTKPCISEYDCASTRVLDPRVAYQITDILSDNQARSSAFGTNSVLNFPNHQVAVKTGTTNNLRDNWTIGYTKDRLVAVWVGNNNNTPMSYIASGITGASPVWNKLISVSLNNEQPHRFEPPTNLAKVRICSLTGQLACDGCPSREEYFIPGTEPTNHCTSESIARILNTQKPD